MDAVTAPRCIGWSKRWSVRVCVVEDNKLLLDNLSMLLGGESGIDVAGTHGSAEEALDGTPWEEVDVLLADIDLPGMSGVEMIRLVKRDHPRVNCMAYTVYEDRATVFSAIKAGACGYLVKGCSPRDLVESLRELHEGGAPMTPRIARKVLLDIQVGEGEVLDGDSVTLSVREAAILKEVERGLSYKQIAATLSISPHTVHTHIKNIYEKVHANSRDEALRRARNLGVI
jgi:two-component system NarL family response regulator